MPRTKHPFRRSKTEEKEAALRSSLQYLLAHQGRKVVLAIPGSFFGSVKLAQLLFDVIMLSRTAGLRFALTYDALGRANQLLAADGKPELGHDSGPIPPAFLAQLQRASMEAKDEIEKLLAQDIEGIQGIGLTATLKLPAYAVGVVDGLDYGLRGVIKELPAKDSGKLDKAEVIIIPPLGRGHGKQEYHLDELQAARSVAQAWDADKIVAFCPAEDFKILAEQSYTLMEIRQLVPQARGPAMLRLLKMGVQALEDGIERVHLISEAGADGLLPELLTSNYPKACLLSKGRFDNIGKAAPSDIPSILELIKPGVERGAIRPRTFDEISRDIGSFYVFKLDNTVVGCVALKYHRNCAELSCLAVDEEHLNRDYGQKLLDYVEQQARKRRAKRLAALTSRAVDWFRERGFAEHLDFVPPAPMRRARDERNSKVLVKEI